MTTINKKWPWELFSMTTSSLLKPAYNITHGGETWFSVSITTMDKKWPQALITASSLLKLANHTAEIYTHVNLSVCRMKTNLRHSICIN